MDVDVSWWGLVVVVDFVVGGQHLISHLLQKARNLYWTFGLDPIMGTKMKGFMKGLHKISNIFDGKEQEMQIGFPTDVKHVAHIGWDGPSVNPNPGWVNEFRSVNSAPLPCTAGSNNGGGNELVAAPVSPKWSSQEFLLDVGANAASPKEASPQAPAPSAKPPKRNTSSNAPSADGEPAAAVPKHSRRHKSGSDSPSRGESSEGSRKGRRERKTSAGSDSSSSSSSITQDVAPGVPKQSRRKKVAKESAASSGGLVRSSRSKDVKSSSDQGSEEQLPVPRSHLPAKEEGNSNVCVSENSLLCVA